VSRCRGFLLPSPPYLSLSLSPWLLSKKPKRESGRGGGTELVTKLPVLKPGETGSRESRRESRPPRPAPAACTRGSERERVCGSHAARIPRMRGIGGGRAAASPLFARAATIPPSPPLLLQEILADNGTRGA